MLLHLHLDHFYQTLVLLHFWLSHLLELLQILLVLLYFQLLNSSFLLLLYPLLPDLWIHLTEPGLILIISVSDSTNAMLLFCGEVPQAQNSKENIIIVISCFMGDLFGLLNEMV